VIPATARASPWTCAPTPRAEMLELAHRFDAADDDTLVPRMDYLEGVVRKPAGR
jgi:hypothetical protein